MGPIPLYIDVALDLLSARHLINTSPPVRQMAGQGL